MHHLVVVSARLAVIFIQPAVVLVCLTVASTHHFYRGIQCKVRVFAVAMLISNNRVQKGCIFQQWLLCGYVRDSTANATFTKLVLYSVQVVKVLHFPVSI